MAQDLGALTDTWMTNPYMFEPSQLSNPYSNYAGSALPWPPSYNTGTAGGPVNAATGQPIQSFQQWQQQNPGGLSINATPAAPAPNANPFANVQIPQGQNTAVAQPYGGLNAQQWQALPPAQRAAAQNAMSQFQAGVAATPSDSFVASGNNPKGGGFGMGSIQQGLGYDAFNRMAGQPQPQAPQGGGAGAPPNNWMAAINALANPGNPTTMGATVPQVTGYQPAGGVNNAFLQSVGQGQGMNQGFLNALRQIQNRPQQ